MRPEQIRTLDSYIMCWQGRENTGVFTQRRGLWTTWRRVDGWWDGWRPLWAFWPLALCTHIGVHTPCDLGILLWVYSRGVRSLFETLKSMFTQLHQRHNRDVHCTIYWGGEKLEVYWVLTTRRVNTQKYPAANQSKRFVVCITMWMDFKNEISKQEIRKQNEVYNIYGPFT